VLQHTTTSKGKRICEKRSKSFGGQEKLKEPTGVGWRGEAKDARRVSGSRKDSLESIEKRNHHLAWVQDRKGKIKTGTEGCLGEQL